MPKLKVVRVSEGDCKYVPGIRIAGKWLEQYGFKLGDQVVIEAQHGRIEIKRVEKEDDGAEAVRV